MSPTSTKIEQFYALKPIRFNLLSRFEWVTVPLVQGYSLRLVLYLRSIRDSAVGSELVLDFQNVRNLRFAAAGLVQPLIEIKDVSAQQWEGVTYEVRDGEHDTIVFLCRDFSASVREETT